LDTIADPPRSSRIKLKHQHLTSSNTTLPIMSLAQISPKPFHDADDDTSTICMTPPESSASIFDEDPLSGRDPTISSSVPWPGSTFIIRSVSTGHVITLLDGKVVLASPGGRGSIHWACVDTKGWLGFRSTVAGRYLGHDERGFLSCSAGRMRGWENFCARARPEGGYVLLMTHFERLWMVGFKEERGVRKLAKVGEKEVDGMVWEFVKVE
jgi:hypothetical protein